MELINAKAALDKYGLAKLVGNKCAFVEMVYGNGALDMAFGELVDPNDCQIDGDTSDVVLFLEVPDGDDYRLCFITVEDDILLSVEPDSEYSDTNLPEPTVADYRELQRQHDALQTELFNASNKLAAYSLCIKRQQADVDQALKVLNAIHDSGVDLHEHEKPLRDYLLEWAFAKAPEIEIANHNAALIREVAQSVRADYGHHTQYSVSLLASGIEGYARAEESQLKVNNQTKAKQSALREAAEKWLADNPDKDPQFSASGSMMFDVNEAAEDIGDAIIKGGEQAGFLIVSPQEIVAAVLMAKQIRQQPEESQE